MLKVGRPFTHSHLGARPIIANAIQHVPARRASDETPPRTKETTAHFIVVKGPKLSSHFSEYLKCGL
jgi:hypothetical protein